MKQIRFNKQSQSGMALIAVLLFLILITIAGAIAVRQSSVDLKLATADQAGTLLLNSSDSVLASIEETANSTTQSSPNYASVFGDAGIIGYFINTSTSKINEQIKRCYTPNINELFSLHESTILLEGGGIRGGDKGVCNPAKSGDYTSTRQTAMTQIILKGIESSDYSTDNTQGLTEGEDGSVNTGESINPKIQMNSVSVLPALSSASDTQIKECFKKPVGQDVKNIYKINDGKSMTACLRDIGVPTTALVEEVILIQDVGSRRL